VERPGGTQERDRTRLRLARAVCGPLPPILAQRARDIIDPPGSARDQARRFDTHIVTGSPFSGWLNDFIAYPCAVHGYFNWRNLAIARAVCRPGAAIAEVGASIGTETVGFSDIVGPSGAIHAFEPYPPNVAILRENVARTRARNVVVYPIAVSDRSERVRFAAPAATNSGVGYVVDEATSGDDEIVEVESARLDDLASELGQIRLLSIDAEGHEGAILRGAANLIARDRPVIVLEALEELLARAGHSCAGLARDLREQGYSIFRIARLGLVPLDAGSGALPTDADWAAIPMETPSTARSIHRMLRRCGLTPVAFGLNPLSA
jgi:FkbM family methyltransferase